MIKCNGMRMAALPLFLDKVGLSAEEWASLMNDSMVPLMMLRAQGELYLEVEAAGRILSGTSSGQSWLNFIAQRGLRRKLTKAEKIKVAASQKWRCMRCQDLLDETFEVDHVEQHALRGDDSSSNVQALCPHCHRKKTHDDLYLSSPYFGVSAMQHLQQDAEHRKATNKSFYEQQQGQQEQGKAACEATVEVGVSHRPRAPLPFSRFHRPATVFNCEPNDA